MSFEFSKIFESPSWNVIGSLGAAAAALAAFGAIRQSNKQLKIEQTPYVTLDHILRQENRFGFAIKNIGKGPAVHVTFSISDKTSNRNEAFFSDDQPHSANLRSSEESHYWMVDNNVLERLSLKGGFAFLYIFFEDQANNLFRTRVKIKKIIKSGGIIEYTVMENQFEELKEKGEK